MKILLTGHRGNLGSSIIKNCVNDEISGLGRNEWGDLDNMLDNVDIVIHTAYDLKKRLDEHPSSMIESNVLSTTRLLESIKKRNVSKFIFISSCAVYGESMKTNEETARCPVSVNGITKLLNEKIIESFCHSNSIDFKIYRIFNMYGGLDNFSILHKLKLAIGDGAEFTLNNHGLAHRDFVHVEDVAKIILKLNGIEHRHKYINIGTGITTKISAIVDLVKSKYPHMKIKETSVAEAEYSRADISKLNSLVKYEFTNILDYIEKNF